MAENSPVQDQAYYLNEIQYSIKRELTADEARALKQVLDRVVRIPSPKIVNLNIRFWLIKKLYLQIYFGEEKRDKSRKERDSFEKERLKEYKNRDDEYYFRMLPEEIANSFHFEQKRLIKDVFKRAIKIPTKKIMEGNISIGFKKKYYFAFFLGFDRRKKKRAGANALMDRLSFLGSVIIYSIVILFVGYFAKTVMGYDIIKGSHGIDYLIEKSGLLK